MVPCAYRTSWRIQPTCNSLHLSRHFWTSVLGPMLAVGGGRGCEPTWAALQEPRLTLGRGERSGIPDYTHDLGPLAARGWLGTLLLLGLSHHWLFPPDGALGPCCTGGGVEVGGGGRVNSK